MNFKYLCISVFLFAADAYSSATVRVLITNKSQVVIQNEKKQKMTIAYRQGGMTINNNPRNHKCIDINTTGIVYIDGTAYRGTASIVSTNGSLYIINKVGLEEYLYSVVPSEVYQSWHHNTLKSQAVAARSYALFESDRNKNNFFDLYSDYRSQVYKGITAESPVTSKAVADTFGQVLTYDNKVIKSYYSSSSGGRTASGAEIGDNQPYLQAVGSYLGDKNPHKNWQVEVPLQKIEQEYKTGRIHSVNVASRSPSGRIKDILIRDYNGNTYKVDAYKFRSYVGNLTMKSTLADIKLGNNGNLLIYGSGYGHGVGMGQWEAEALAQQGASYSQILSHFYRGTQLKKLY